MSDEKVSEGVPDYIQDRPYFTHQTRRVAHGETIVTNHYRDGSKAWVNEDHILAKSFCPKQSKDEV